MVINFKIREINRNARKLVRTLSHTHIYIRKWCQCIRTYNVYLSPLTN